ncbi:MAG: hypothetical protein A2128_02455 [Candidatus Liptonbacteria bacterium GWC1_60_9]|uniref:DAC domain-containing protein n=3 Tax=Candidatus Liptoniibacteriota TaxID=1817909 RepID=A0A1G2CJY9_9BACT|nr:MAG: hypothetical protein A2128_02455 [Candidatus Liptonbacteria bacterium GWC1_60_9]OGY99969.1 MAG: hypothetical protein A3E09_02670 [Candidatus Liptonbacteria bacterium RIFCSPHIGHO2_12_FULL_60_13]OGZ01669.1 MAG: hypothetical protein A3G64_00160 [Candidatus Liptonbacteria bacterium RIFCSPLOWO2_12_FULL_60_15]
MFSKGWYEKVKKDRSVWGTLQKVESCLADSGVALPMLYKLRLAEFVLRLRKRFHKKFGLLIVFGWQNKWLKKYADLPDASQDIFKKHPVRIFRFQGEALQDLGNERFISKHLRELVNFDGAILVDKKGAIVRSGVYLEGLRPKIVVEKLYPGHASDLSSRFGFRKKVHARHLAAITVSYVLRGTTVYTLSEETGDFHIFERGKIVYSTARGETKAG